MCQAYDKADGEVMAGRHCVYVQREGKVRRLEVSELHQGLSSILFGSSVSGTQVIQQERGSGTGHLGRSVGVPRARAPSRKSGVSNSNSQSELALSHLRPIICCHVLLKSLVFSLKILAQAILAQRHKTVPSSAWRMAKKLPVSLVGWESSRLITAI